MDKEFFRRRAPFYAPRGTVNLALHKTVTSSDERPIIGSLNLVTDGGKKALDGNWVELAPGKQWVQIDLGRTCNVYGVLFWHYYGELRLYYNVIVQVSSDPRFVKGVQTIFNNDQKDEFGLGRGHDLLYYEINQGKLIDAKGPQNRGVVGRYVRLYSKGNTSDAQNHYTEVEVYGKPVMAPQKPAKAAGLSKSKTPEMVEIKFGLPPAPYR